MAAEGLIRLIELRGSGLEQAQHRRLRRKLYPVYRSGNELGVIESIVKVDAELDLLPLTDTEVLEDREIKVVNARHLERVSTAIGLGSRTRLNVLGIGIISNVCNHCWTAIGHCIPIPVDGMDRARS